MLLSGGKYISVKAPEQKRFVHFKTLGDYYSEDILCERIQIALEEKANSSKGKVNDFNRIFYERIYQVSELVKKNEKLPRKYFKNQPYLLQNDFDVCTLSAQLAVINRDNIHSLGELKSKIEKLTAEYESARQEINKLSEKLSQFEAVEKQVGGYFDLLLMPFPTRCSGRSSHGGICCIRSGRLLEEMGYSEIRIFQIHGDALKNISVNFS